MFMGAMLWYLVVLGGALLAIGLSANAIWRAVMPPAGLPRHGAACGSCGYELSTLEAGRCSECGADLLKSGVNTRHGMVRTAGSLPAALMGWTIVMITLGTIVGGVIMSVVFMNAAGNMSNTQTITTTKTFEPMRIDRDGDGRRERSAEYEIAFAFDGEFAWGTGPSAGTVSIEVAGDDVPAPLTMEYDVETRAYTVVDADGAVLHEDTGFGAADAEAMLRDAGLDVADEGIAAEAVQVGELFESLMDDPQNFEMMGLMASSSNLGGLQHSGGTTNYGGMGPGNLMSTSGTELAVLLGLLGTGLLIYISGIVLIVRRRAKMIARPRAG